MRKLLMLSLAAALLAACGGGNNGTSSSASSRCRDSNDAPSNKAHAGNEATNEIASNPGPEPEPQPLPPPAGLPELFVDGWYRAPGGVAIVQFPEIPDGWSLKYSEGESGRIVTLSREGASAIFTFLPPNNADATDIELAQALAAALAHTVIKELPVMKLTRNAEALDHAGGFCAARFLEGKSDQGVEMSCIVAAVAEGKEAAMCLCLSRKDLLNAAWNDLAAKVLEDVRVGKHVPQLPVHNPIEPLSGVYQGPTSFGAVASHNTEYWMVFDKRGWCHEYSPDDERDLELDAVYQWKPESCLRYRLEDGKLELLTADGKPKKSFKCTVKKDKLVLDGHDWWYMTQTAPLTLEGHYEAFSFYSNPGYGSTFTFSSSQNYWFTKDGRFSFESSTMSTLTDDPGWPPADGFRDWAHAYSETPKNYGRYRIVNNILQLKFEDGRRSAKTIFVHQGGDAGLLHIDGSVYLEQK